MLVQHRQLKDATDLLDKLFEWLEGQAPDVAHTLIIHIIQSETKSRLHSIEAEINKAVQRNRTRNESKPANS